MKENAARDDLLEELAKFASADLVADARRLSTDEAIRDMIAGAKDQLAFYKSHGLEDMGKKAHNG